MPQGNLTFVGGGAPIAVAATATPGTLLWTCVSGTTQIEAVRLVVSNIDGATVTLTLEVGGTATANQLVYDIPAKTILELPVLKGNNGMVIRGFASSANKINAVPDAVRYTL